jgi:hypothetical protein
MAVEAVLFTKILGKVYKNAGFAEGQNGGWPLAASVKTPGNANWFYSATRGSYQSRSGRYTAIN